MNKKHLIVLLFALCALLCACVPTPPEPDANGFYAVGDEIVFTTELEEAFATFCVTEVSVSDKMSSIAATDIDDGCIVKDCFVIEISYELEFATVGTAVDQTYFNVTDCNGNEAVFLHKTGISGDDIAAQTFEYGVESIGEYVDIFFVYDESKGYTAAVRAYFDPDAEQAVLGGALNEDESIFDDPTIRILNIVSAAATSALLAIAVAVFAIINKKRKSSIRAEADKIASLAAASMPARYNPADPDFTANIPALKLKALPKPKKKGFLFGLLSILAGVVPALVTGGVITVMGLIQDPDMAVIGIFLYAIIVFIVPWVCPFITVWGNMAGVILGGISALRHERNWISYTALILNSVFYVITLIYLLCII